VKRNADVMKEYRFRDAMIHIPKISGDMPDLFVWLEKQKLVRPAPSYDTCVDIHNPIEQQEEVVTFTTLAVPVDRVRAFTRENRLKQVEAWQKINRNKSLSNDQMGAMWQELKNPSSAIRELQINRIPADAMAFYRPFHFPPFNQWGIYILLDKLFAYYKTLTRALATRAALDPVSLMHFVLFEIFHHEFFHHLVESAATTCELILAAANKPIPVYMDYWNRKYDKIFSTHPHNPLEEALANAYAYNSFTFISRVQAGYKTLAVRMYQSVMKNYWHTEPKGYCEAMHYIEGNQIPGASCLLAMLLNEPSCGDSVPLMKLAKSVMPNGFTSFTSKPEIPTYFVAKPDVIDAFMKIVPVPVDAYTSLFWPLKTEQMDLFIKKKKEEEKKFKEAMKASKANRNGYDD